MSDITFDNAAPLGSASANTADNELRDLKTGIFDRMRQGGQRWTTGGADGDNDGKHVPVDTADPPVPSDAGQWSLWDAAGTTRKINYFGPTHATKPDRFETVSEIYAGPSGDKKIAGIATAAWIRASIGDAAPVASSYLKRVVYKVPNGSPTRTLKRVMVIVGTRPVGADLVVEVRKRAAADLGTTVDRYTDTLNTVQTTVTLADAGDPFTAENTGLSITLASDDELTIKYGTVGTTTPASDATILLQIE